MFVEFIKDYIIDLDDIVCITTENGEDFNLYDSHQARVSFNIIDDVNDFLIKVKENNFLVFVSGEYTYYVNKKYILSISIKECLITLKQYINSYKFIYVDNFDLYKPVGRLIKILNDENYNHGGMVYD